MAITIKREKNERGVKLSSLKVGDTFLYDNRVGVMVERNGHAFPIDMTTCGNFRVIDPRYWRNAEHRNGELPPEAIVLPISVELSYKVVG